MTTFSDTTLPSARLYSGSNSGITVSEIAATGDIMWFRIGGLTSAGLCGDCLTDGSIDILDGLKAAQIAVGLGTGLAASPNSRCDVDSDGAISVLDALTIAQVSSGRLVFLICN